MLILENEIDDAVLLILSALHADASDQDSHRGEPGLSLARLSKRTELRMSTLRRHLSALEDAEIVSVAVNEDGTGRAALTPYGMAIFDALDETTGVDY
ncbi:helix-turn-helix domain-containing protein [Collimonas humicola]|uniref:helix-turn-helix domain-containing protein n=1 Tax=Collimonas humicola TaxID=2825886 RepID=UPI001B8AE07F|nr:helix-turn-helix domain-containing protein [Collimonas humicola]